MRINHTHRRKLKAYLDGFYKAFRNERYTVFHFVKFFKQRLKADKDAWLGVSGDTGVGKSRTVLMIMILFGRPMSLLDNVAYVPKGKEIMDMFDKLNFNCLLVDEAAREMRSVNWQSKQQQGVNTKAMTDRFKNNMVFLNMPSFNEFTKSMRQTNLQFRMIIPYRTKHFARVIVQRKNRNWRSDDPWSDVDADKRYQKVQKRHGEISNDMILSIERSLPVYVMDFIVPDLELPLPEVIEEYERLKKESRIEEEENEPEVQKNKFKIKFEDLFERLTKLLWYNKLGIGTRKITKKELCEELGVTTDQFTKFLKLPPKKAEETLTFREKIQQQEKENKKRKKKDPLGLLGKKKEGY